MIRRLIFLVIAGLSCATGFCAMEVEKHGGGFRTIYEKGDPLGFDFNLISEEEGTVGVYWSFISSEENAGDVVIPSEILYGSKKYSVVAILSNRYFFTDNEHNIFDDKYPSEGKFPHWFVYKSLTIPASVTYIAPDSYLNYVETETYIVDEENPAYKSLDGVVMTKDEKTLLAYPSRLDKTIYRVPESVTKLAPFSFHLTTAAVELNDNISSIGEYAFYEYPYHGLRLPSSVKEIGKGAFYKSDIEAITIPEGVSEIPVNTFAYSPVEAVSFPSSVSLISTTAFKGTADFSVAGFKGTNPPSGIYDLAFLSNYKDDFTVYSPMDAVKSYEQVLAKWSGQGQVKVYPVKDMLWVGSLKDLTIEAGKQRALSVGIAEFGKAAVKDIKWESENSSIIEIDGDILRAITSGTARINCRVIDNGDQVYESSFEVTVSEGGSGIQAITSDNIPVADGIYDLNGRKLQITDPSFLPKGIYIQISNGRSSKIAI